MGEEAFDEEEAVRDIRMGWDQNGGESVQGAFRDELWICCIGWRDAYIDELE